MSHVSSSSSSRPERVGCWARALYVAALLGLLAVPGTASSQLVDGCPDHSYLGNRPSDRDEPDWSEQAQGIANDGRHWFFTNERGLFKYDANWRDVDGDDIGKLGGVGFPSALIPLGIDHFGDPDYYAGYIFVPFEDNHEGRFPCEESAR